MLSQRFSKITKYSLIVIGPDPLICAFTIGTFVSVVLSLMQEVIKNKVR